MLLSLKSILNRLIKGRGITWQLRRNTQTKVEAIKTILQKIKVNSVLDIGCNAGEITRRLGEAGYFAVGVDKKLDFRGIIEPLNGICLGQIECNIDLLDKLPQFDAILLLSVHHQMINIKGNEWTKQFVSKLAAKSNKIFLIEFSAKNSKYGKADGELFLDNDEKSVITYAANWLKATLPNFNCLYVGKILLKKGELSKGEPFRMLFQCLPKISETFYSSTPKR